MLDLDVGLAGVIVYFFFLFFFESTIYYMVLDRSPW